MSICPRPLKLRQGEVPCGKCGNCMVNRKRQKTARMLCEKRAWERVGGGEAMFVTLTYAPERLPLSVPPESWDFEKVKAGKQRTPLPTLNYDHITGYIKRVRFALSQRRLSHAWVAEYGDQTWRPHYHAILFNVGPDDEEMLREKWSHGFVQADEFTKERAAYVCGYVSKKLTQPKKELMGRRPEKFMWSLKPAIGKKYVPFLVDMLETTSGRAYIRKYGDIIGQVRIGGKTWPLDRNMRNWCRLQWNSRNPSEPIALEAANRPEIVHPEPTEAEWTQISNQAVRRGETKRRGKI